VIPIFEWKGKPVIPTKQAVDELDFNDIDLCEAIEILESGFDCSRSRRCKDIFERCIRKGKKVLKIVAVERDNCFKIIHAGKFSSKRWQNGGLGKNETDM
jgi:hypothetical protein